MNVGRIVRVRCLAVLYACVCCCMRAWRHGAWALHPNMRASVSHHTAAASNRKRYNMQGNGTRSGMSPRFFQSFLIIALLVAGLGLVSGLLAVGYRAPFFRRDFNSVLSQEQQQPRQAYDTTSTANWLLPAEQYASQHSVDVFTSMAPFSEQELDELRQLEAPLLHPRLLALASWLTAGPHVTVYWLGYHASYAPVLEMLPAEHRARVVVEPRIDVNFYDKPLFNSMWRRAEASTADFVVFTNADIYIQSSWWRVLQHAERRFDSFLLVACRMDLDHQLPEMTDALVSGSDASKDALFLAAKELATVHDYGGIDIWVWNNKNKYKYKDGSGSGGAVELAALDTVMPRTIPPFTFGRAKYDNWITHELIATPGRRVVDVTHALLMLHVEHKRVGGRKPKAGAVAQANRNFWSANKMHDWEIYANAILSYSFGTYSNQEGTSLFAPQALMPCEEESAQNHVCLLRRIRPGKCPCEHTVWSKNAQSDPRRDPVTSQMICGLKRAENTSSFPLVAARPPGGVHTLNGLLSTLVPGSGSKDARQVVLLTATKAERDAMLNWVCNYRKNTGYGGPTWPFMIAALDEDIFRAGFLSGLPIFFAGVEATAELSACADAISCSAARRKLDCSHTLQLLRQGVDVLFTSVNTVWFAGPESMRVHFGGPAPRNTLYVQSQEVDPNQPANGVQHLRTQFYFVPSGEATIAAFQDIISRDHGLKGARPPSLYTTVCGSNGEHRIGTDRCTHAGVTVQFLPQNLFANSRILDHWAARSAQQSCTDAGCLVLSSEEGEYGDGGANAEGYEARMTRHGLWRLNAEGSCLHDWQRTRTRHH